jgi:hypothetical protein
MWAEIRPTTRPPERARKKRAVAVAEERVQAPGQERHALHAQRRHPMLGDSMQPVRQVDERVEVAPRRDRLHHHGHARTLHMATPAQARPDVFAKAREHERLAMLAAARDADVLPYFRTLTSPALPVVEMEGARRIMLGSNNYLGLTDDPGSWRAPATRWRPTAPG